jgi:hypothetical protein
LFINAKGSNMAKLINTPAGWQLTKTNRLKAPVHNRPVHVDVKTHNYWGEPLAQLGEYVLVGRSVSAGTIGRLVAVKDMWFQSCGWGCKVEMLDGTMREEWQSWCFKITPDMLQEVKDFYINDGRAGRIKVSW